MALLPILPIASLAFFGLSTPGISYLSLRGLKRDISAEWALTGLFLSLGLSLYLPFGGLLNQSFGNLLRIDLFSIFFAVVFLVVGIFVGIASRDYLKGEPNQDMYYALLLLATVGMLVIASSVDLLILYVGWELMGVASYTLAGFKKKDPASNEGAIKFFIMSALSSALIVYAISLFYGVTGTTSLTAIPISLAEETRAFGVLATALFIVGFGVKMAAVPFHMWIPDTFEGAPTTISALLAAGAKKAAFASIFRIFLLPILAFRVQLGIDWVPTVAIVALVTMTLGNVAALMQKSILRLLAYSSIAHAGFILIGLAAPGQTGVAGALFHILNHAILKTAAFIAAAAVIGALGSASLDNFKGLGSKMPWTSVNLSIAFFALAGVPPLNGFYSKLILFTAAVQDGLSWLAIAGLLNSAFSMAYYGWVIKRMYFDDAENPGKVREPTGYVTVLVAASVLSILIGIYPQPWIDLSFNAATI